MEKKQFTLEIYHALVEAVNNLPPQAIESTKASVTHKGYDTTGYQYQYLVNVVNEIVGVNNWGFTFKVIKEIAGQFSKGGTFYDITTEIDVWILDAQRKGSGGNRSIVYADAHKGAITNAMKKTLAMFGIGKKAYEGILDEDYLPYPIETQPRISPPINAGTCPQCNSALRQSKFNENDFYCGSYPNCRYKTKRGNQPTDNTFNF